MRDLTMVAVPSDPKYLSVIRAVTGRVGQLCGLTDSVTEEIKLAVDEACSNVIKYAYSGDRNKKILVRFRVVKGNFEVVIEDVGMKAPSEPIQGRDLNDLRPGGLGAHLINRAFDVVSFDKERKKGNRLRLIRALRAK